MNIKFSKAFLMSGEDYKLTESVILHHPSVREILSIDQSAIPDYSYWIYINIILSDPYSNMVMLDDMGKNYLEITPFEVFIIQWELCVEDYNRNKATYDMYNINPLDNILKALNFFIEGDHKFAKGNYSDGSVVFYDINNKMCQINQEVFECLYEWVKSINKIEYSGRINPADENARRILIEDARDEIKKRKKNKKKTDDSSDHLGNIMSATCFCGNGSITPFNINDCKIYWLNESLSIVNKKSNADHLLDGVYHGTISSKDVNKSELNWIE